MKNDQRMYANNTRNMKIKGDQIEVFDILTIYVGYIATKILIIIFDFLKNESNKIL